ncbi:MAG: hypothetical protein WC197_00940 [Candidatus Gastranaerophilaceae bacterium]|jgi:hypothetical protein
MNFEELLKYLKDKKIQKYINKLVRKYKNKKVLIYGAGLFFEVLRENFDLSKLNIVAISDKSFEQDNEYKGLKAVSFDKIKNLSFDVMIIATLEPERLENIIKTTLYPTCGKFQIDYFNNYSFKDFLAEIITFFS